MTVRKKHILFVLCMLCIESMFSQTVILKGRIWHNKRGAMKQMKITVDGAATVTDDDGFFRTAISKNTSSVRVLLTTNIYSILYPFGGEVLVPADAKKTADIIIGSLKENEYVQQYITINRTIKTNASLSTTDVDSLKAQLNRITALLMQMNYSENDLRVVREIQEGKDRFFPDISTILKDYKNKAFSLVSAFQYVSSYALERQDAFYVLKDAIENYNKAFEKYDQQQLNFARYITQYWQDDSLKKDYMELTTLALTNIHRENIYPLQQQIDQIRTYLSMKPKDKTLKNEIIQKINDRVTQLNLLLKELDDQTTQFLLVLGG